MKTLILILCISFALSLNAQNRNPHVTDKRPSSQDRIFGASVGFFKPRPPGGSSGSPVSLSQESIKNPFNFF